MRTWLDEILLSNRAILQPNKEFNCLPTLIYQYYYRYAKKMVVHISDCDHFIMSTSFKLYTKNFHIFKIYSNTILLHSYNIVYQQQPWEALVP